MVVLLLLPSHLPHQPESLNHLPKVMAQNGINKTALIIVGNSVKQADYEKSKLYSPDFTTGFRKGRNTDD